MGEDDTRPPNKAGPEEPPNIPDCSIPDVANSVAAAILSLRVKHAMPSSGTVLPVQVCSAKVFSSVSRLRQRERGRDCVREKE